MQIVVGAILFIAVFVGITYFASKYAKYEFVPPGSNLRLKLVEAERDELKTQVNALKNEIDHLEKVEAERDEARALVRHLAGIAHLDIDYAEVLDTIARWDAEKEGDS